MRCASRHLRCSVTAVPSRQPRAFQARFRWPWILAEGDVRSSVRQVLTGRTMLTFTPDPAQTECQTRQSRAKARTTETQMGKAHALAMSVVLGRASPRSDVRTRSTFSPPGSRRIATCLIVSVFSPFLEYMIKSHFRVTTDGVSTLEFESLRVSSAG